MSRLRGRTRPSHLGNEQKIFSPPFAPLDLGQPGESLCALAVLAPVLGRVSMHLLREGTCVPVSTDGGFIQG